MIIELKKVKIARHLSQETEAFSAEIHVDGKVAAYASNQGCGGCNRYDFVSPALRDLLEDEAKKAKPQSMESLAERVGAPTHLCLNAGILSGHTGAPWEAPPAEWQRMLAVNLGGVVNGLRAFVPPMLTSGDPCSILITGSLAGVLTWPGGGPYAATKHAVVAVAEQAAQALQHTNIAVTLLCPALVRTAMSEVGESANDVAEQALSAMDARQFAVIPAAWSAAISRRAQGLTDGRRPTVPTLE